MKTAAEPAAEKEYRSTMRTRYRLPTSFATLCVTIITAMAGTARGSEKIFMM